MSYLQTYNRVFKCDHCESKARTRQINYDKKSKYNCVLDDNCICKYITTLNMKLGVNKKL